MFIKILFLVLFNSLLIFNNAHADKINNIKISGNDRISDQTIILFSGVNINDDIGTNEINNICRRQLRLSHSKYTILQSKNIKN